MSELSNNTSYCFLVIGKTQESTDTTEFKRYMGIGSSFVLAVNPTKAELEKIYGNEQDKEPEYVVDGENGKEVRVHFIVKTNAEQCGGIEITNRLMFTLRNAPAYNRDQTKVQVIDAYGNTTWADTDDAKAGKALTTNDGKNKKIDAKYRMACVGEADLVHFLKTYLRVPEAFEYKNGSWVKKANANDGLFGLEHIKDYFNGDFSELRDALKMQPNNKVKLLYGVRTAETENGTRQFQAVASKADFITFNNAGLTTLQKMEKRLAEFKAAGGYPNTEFAIQPLAEYTVQATDLNKAPEASVAMPWD